MSGTTPTSLALLTALKTLELWGNTLSGTLAISEFSQLTALQTLTYGFGARDNCELSGTISEALAALTSMQQLCVVALAADQFTIECADLKCHKRLGFLAPFPELCWQLSLASKIWI